MVVFLYTEKMIDRLKQYLTMRGISERGLSEQVGVSQQSMNNYMNRQYRMSVDVAMKILELFPDLSAEWLLRGEGEMKKAKGDKVIGNLQRMYEELLSDRDKRIRELEIKLAERNLKIG